MTRHRKPTILVLEAGTGATYLRRWGANVVSVSPRDIDGVEQALDAKFDGLVLMGGGDVDPRLYGEKPHKKVYGVSEVRDFCEWLALDVASDYGIPVLGICRGSQLMAVHNGGRLKQHIAGHRGVDHYVFSQLGTRFSRTIGQAAKFVSLHHQVILRHGSGFRVAGRDRDGNIEAIESRDGRCLGVQFHPEMDHWRNGESRAIFRWLVHEAAERAGLPKPAPETIVPKATPIRSKKAKAPGKKRKAGQQTLPAPRGRRLNPVKVSWVCPHCAIRFDGPDARQDREDHIYWIHGDPKIKTTEPPPGHPDWMPEDPIETPPF